jgi:hypothetical protein
VPSNLSPDAIGYVVYEYLGGNYCMTEIARVSGRNATSFVADGITPLGYTIAVDEGIRVLPITQRHTQPRITSATYNPCKYTLELQWSPYIGWEDVGISYKIFNVVNGVETLVASDIEENIYTWQNVPDQTELDVYVQAVNKNDNSIVSNSPWQHVSATSLKRPAFINLTRLDYIDNSVELQFAIDQATEITHFEIQRSTTSSPPLSFETLHVFNDKTQTAYKDNQADAIYQYRVVAKNECGDLAHVSFNLQNFKLSLTSDSQYWYLDWNEPEDHYQYFFYMVERLTPQPAVIATNILTTDYADPIPSMIDELSLQFCYELTAVDSTVGGYSYSRACAYYTPNVGMPDAIDPLSMVINSQTGRRRNQFGPVVNARPETYTYCLEIINRNGAKIAEISKGYNDDPLECSWDGRFKGGDLVSDEVYTYILTIEFQGGYHKTMKGIVTVMYQ